MKSLQDYAKLFHAKTITLSGGTSVFYREANKSTGKKTLIVVHGLTGTHYSMLQMAGVWAEQGMHVIAVDLPGHGKTEQVELAHFDDLAKWLHEVIETVYPKGTFTLIGNSFGSSVCAAYAMRFGLREESGMVLGAPIPTISPIVARLERLSTRMPNKLLMKVYYENNLIELIRMWVLLGVFKDKQLRGRLRESLRSEAAIVQHNYAYTVLMPRYYEARPFEQLFSTELRNKTVVVYGAKDRIAGKKVGELMSQWLTADRVFRAEHSGHLVHIEAITELTDALDQVS